VGVLLTDTLQYAFTDEVATTFLSAFVEAMAPTGLALTLLTSAERDDAVPARDIAIDGAMVYSCHPESAARDWLLRRKLPLVFVDQEPAAGIASVNVDDRGGARAAAQHVIDLGHRRIGIINVALDGPTGIVEHPMDARLGYPQRQRLVGWLDALDEAGIKPIVVHVHRNEEEEATQAARTLLAGQEPISAVLCFSDVLALGVLRAAEGLGLAVPSDVSVVEFDDSPVAHRAHPPLTTVRQDLAAKGRLAASALTAAIERDPSRPKARARHVTVPTEVIVRQSTASVPRV
jgi:DNA-binding LacI/PurR family transcriptional regulator